MKPYIFSSTLGLLILTVLQFILLSPKNQDLKVYFLDVGQGDSILFNYPTGEHLLVDTGKDSRVFRALDKVLPWYDRTIDYVLLTHGDIDHVGAMLDILDRYKVETVFVSQFFGQIEIEKDILERLKIEGASVEVLKFGDTFTFGTTITNSFKIIHPDPGCMIKYQNENDCSLVALASYGSSTVLLTGDIGKEVERQILPYIKDSVTVLKVAHHGSKNSTDKQFVQQIDPQFSVISSGENSYGHPSPEAVNTLLTASSTVWNTKEDATIVASSDGTTVVVEKLFDQASFFQSGICSILLYGFDTSC